MYYCDDTIKVTMKYYQCNKLIVMCIYIYTYIYGDTDRYQVFSKNRHRQGKVLLLVRSIVNIYIYIYITINLLYW